VAHRRVIDYLVLRSDDQRGLCDGVADLLGRHIGWEPHGSLQVVVHNHHLYYVQAMVRIDED
jgi:hypothetical protein